MKKMNKKGFTLVELLAVIAILAILILLVTPNILKMFNEGKESIFVQQAQRVMDASNNKYMSVSQIKYKMMKTKLVIQKLQTWT